MKFCTECGTQLRDDDVFCTKCGCKTYQVQSQEETINSSNNIKTNHVNYKNSQRQIKQSSLPKSNFNKLMNIFGFENIGEKLRKTAKIMSLIYKIFFIVFLGFCGVALLFINPLVVVLLFPILCLLLIIANIPLWALYALGDIYDFICKDESNDEQEND